MNRRANHLGTQQPTQPSIPPGWANPVSACQVGVKVGCVYLCQVSGNTV